MENIEVVVDSQKFIFKTEPNFIDERKIQNEMAELAGGWDKFAQLNAAIANTYQKHLDYNNRTMGKDEFQRIFKRYLELQVKEKTAEDYESTRSEYTELYNTITSNKYYKEFTNLVNEKSLLEGYAKLKVLCIEKPREFDFSKTDENYCVQLMNAVYEKKNSLTTKQTG
jgi:hypothetical protein